MQLALIRELTEETSRIVTSKKVVLTERDLEIIEFIIDMKFASVEDVFEKFFKVTLQAHEAKSDLWARKRLFQLEQGNFLKLQRSDLDNRSYYTATFKGYYALCSLKPEKYFIKPMRTIDQRTFDHDKLLLKCRLDLERKLKVSDWISDRKLKQNPNLSGGLSSVHVPDGIYKLPDGRRIAFELEISRKAKSRYIDKIKKYVQLMRAESDALKKFDVVQIVCTQQPVYRLLSELTDIYGDIFKVQTAAMFADELLGVKNA